MINSFASLRRCLPPFEFIRRHAALHIFSSSSSICSILQQAIGGNASDVASLCIHLSICEKSLREDDAQCSQRELRAAEEAMDTTDGASVDASDQHRALATVPSESFRGGGDQSQPSSERTDRTSTASQSAPASIRHRRIGAEQRRRTAKSSGG